MMQRPFLFVAAVGFAAGLAAGPAPAQDLDLSLEASHRQIEAWANEPIDTSKYKKEPPYKVGLSAGYLSNSWILFCSQLLRHEASLHPEVGEVLVTDAAFNPAKQVADIEDLVSKGVDLLLFWPVDEKTLLPALQKAADAGVATINVGYNFMHSPYVTGNAYVNQWDMTMEGARRFVDALGGKGRIFAMMPIAGSSAAVVQLATLQSLIKDKPEIELLTVEYGDWNRAKAKQLTENVLQRFDHIDGVFSPAAQMSMGILEAFDEAGRGDEATFSPGDEYNGWLKWVKETGKAGSMTSGLEVGRAAVRHGVAILKGEPAKNAVIVPTRYLTPEEAAAMYEEGRPDDWWPTDLPAEWLPK
jgi:ABC-type sugar transport system substrate-binding protein